MKKKIGKTFVGIVIIIVLAAVWFGLNYKTMVRTNRLAAG
jgi:hypothetical protein